MRRYALVVVAAALGLRGMESSSPVSLENTHKARNAYERYAFDRQQDARNELLDLLEQCDDIYLDHLFIRKERAHGWACIPFVKRERYELVLYPVHYAVRDKDADLVKALLRHKNEDGSEFDFNTRDQHNARVNDIIVSFLQQNPRSGRTLNTNEVLVEAKSRQVQRTITQLQAHVIKKSFRKKKKRRLRGSAPADLEKIAEQCNYKGKCDR